MILQSLQWLYCSVNSTDPKIKETSINDLLHLDQLTKLVIMRMDGVTYPENYILDLRNLKDIVLVQPHSEVGDWEGGYTGPSIEKLILSNDVKDNNDGAGTDFTLLPYDLNVEYVD